MQTPIFQYTNPAHMVYSIDVGNSGQTEVVGDPEKISYEWLIRTPSGVSRFSDSAYDCAEIALRDRS
jgi:hypothetical protein